jgi:ATP-dependent protease HslVU (ClpYQ) peptidase subunit
MTIIAGACRGGRVWLGGDASASDGATMIRSTDPKVWRSGGVLLGGSGEFRTIDAARRIDCPALPTEQWVRYGFTSELAKMYRELDGCFDSSQRPEEGSLLLGALGRLWLVVHPRLAVVALGQYAAEGSGSDFALGAMHARPRASPRTQVLAALHAAAEHATTCAGPFTLVSL